MDELITKVEQWAIDRGLHRANPAMQLNKLLEEAGELAHANRQNNIAEVVDAIGDITVVLIVYCSQLGLDFSACLQSAYSEIKNRKGKMVNGMFIKESDLEGNL